MRYTQLRGRKKVSLQVLLTFSCMNLKKLANWKWGTGKKTGLLSRIRIFINNILKIYQKSLKIA